MLKHLFSRKTNKIVPITLSPELLKKQRKCFKWIKRMIRLVRR